MYGFLAAPLALASSFCLVWAASVLSAKPQAPEGWAAIVVSVAVLILAIHFGRPIPRVDK